MKKQNTPNEQLLASVTTNFFSNEDWRFEKPVWDNQKCIRCGVCGLSCPDGAIFQNGEGYYEADETYCKGCGLCKQQCWTGCISMEPYAEPPPWLALVRKIRS